jgi:hypothetical protein
LYALLAWLQALHQFFVAFSAGHIYISTVTKQADSVRRLLEHATKVDIARFFPPVENLVCIKSFRTKPRLNFNSDQDVDMGGNDPAEEGGPTLQETDDGAMEDVEHSSFMVVPREKLTPEQRRLVLECDPDLYPDTMTFEGRPTFEFDDVCELKGHDQPSAMPKRMRGRGREPCVRIENGDGTIHDR